MKTTVIIKKTGAGHYNVTVMQDYNELGTFETTDMQLIDDISEMQNDGFEHELIMHETFEEVLTTCIKRLNVSEMQKRTYYDGDTKPEHNTKFDGTQTRQKKIGGTKRMNPPKSKIKKQTSTNENTNKKS